MGGDSPSPQRMVDVIETAISSIALKIVKKLGYQVP